MEIHPTLAVKSPGLGDPEAGWAGALIASFVLGCNAK